MQKQTLDQILPLGLFSIPDYQRGYAWEERQWNDFVEDVDALVEETTVRSHYTGTLVTFRPPGQTPIPYGVKELASVDVVDGQQRLTTCTLYLSVIIHRLIRAGLGEYEQEVTNYLYSVDRCKLGLNNDTADIFHDLLRSGSAQTTAGSTHQLRLVEANRYLKDHIEKRCGEKGPDAVGYLKALFRAVTQRLIFTCHVIEEESEIGMTFELMNSRGKDLSVLELLKNYLMHWIYRNAAESQRTGLTNLVNKHWKTTYSNIGATGGHGREDQCLRVAWTLYCDHTPKNWDGYKGFKADDYIPLRRFREDGNKSPGAVRSREETQTFLMSFTEGLALVSRHYARIVSPTLANCVSPREYAWLTKIHHAGNIANFLPLMTAASIRLEQGMVTEADYLALLQALECYAYRVFLFEARRSNSGKSSFYRWAQEVLRGERPLPRITGWVYELMEDYSPAKTFHEWINRPEDWYKLRGLLRYTLFEYELHLVEAEGKGKPLTIEWQDLIDSTIEHILPQTPPDGSEWLAKWTDDERKVYGHDLGNLVLTQNNSHYLNFEFARKKGQAGLGPSYSHSDIRQERDVSAFADWTPKELEERRKKIVDWVRERWKSVV